MNKSLFKESNSLLYCLHGGDYTESALIRLGKHVENTLLYSSGLSSKVGDNIEFFMRAGLDLVDELV